MKLSRFFKGIIFLLMLLAIVTVLGVGGRSYLSSHTTITLLNQNQQEIPFSSKESCTIFSTQKHFQTIIQREYPEYEVQGITRNFFRQTISLSLRLKDQWCSVGTPSGVIALDSEYYAIAKVDPESEKATLNIADAIPIGTRVTSRLIQSGCEYAHAGFSVRAEGETLVSQADQTTVIFPIITGRDEIQERLVTLQKILQQYTIQSKRLERIDLRFSRPIIQ